MWQSRTFFGRPRLLTAVDGGGGGDVTAVLAVDVVVDSVAQVVAVAMALALERARHVDADGEIVARAEGAAVDASAAVLVAVLVARCCTYMCSPIPFCSGGHAST